MTGLHEFNLVVKHRVTHSIRVVPCFTPGTTRGVGCLQLQEVSCLVHNNTTDEICRQTKRWTPFFYEHARLINLQKNDATVPKDLSSNGIFLISSYSQYSPHVQTVPVPHPFPVPVPHPVPVQVPRPFPVTVHKPVGLPVPVGVPVPVQVPVPRPYPVPVPVNVPG